MFSDFPGRIRLFIGLKKESLQAITFPPFSSEIKSLLPLISVVRNQNVDTVSISRYLSFLWCPGSGTPLKSVKKLPPGEALIVKNGCIVNQWQWFQLPVFSKSQKQLNKEQSILGVRNHLRHAVHRQMVSDVPLGAFLNRFGKN